MCQVFSMAIKYVVSEANDQKRVVQWLRGRGCPVISIPNEGKRSPALARHMKDMGLTAGVPDLLLLRPTLLGHRVWVEMKRVGGKLSPEQKAMHAELSTHWTVIVGYGEADAKAKLQALGV